MLPTISWFECTCVDTPGTIYDLGKHSHTCISTCVGSDDALGHVWGYRTWMISTLWAGWLYPGGALGFWWHNEAPPGPSDSTHYSSWARPYTPPLFEIVSIDKAATCLLEQSPAPLQLSCTNDSLGLWWAYRLGRGLAYWAAWLYCGGALKLVVHGFWHLSVV